MAGRDLLGQKFGQLAKLDQGRGRIVKEVALGHRSEASEPLVLRGEKIEVAGDPHQSKSYQFTLQTQIVESAGLRYFSFLTIPKLPQHSPTKPLLMSHYFRF